MLDFLSKLFKLQKELQDRTLENSPVQEFTQSERGRIRAITSICTKDRIVRHVLADDILLPAVRRKIIYDNCASLKGRGISQQRDRFEVHLHRYYEQYGNEGWILLGDFTKFYDNIIHDIAKQQFLELLDNDEFLDWLLTLIFDGFKMDVSYMSEEEFAECLTSIFNKLEYRKIPKRFLTGKKWMAKSVNIGDQISQVVGVYYPHRLDNYVKTVRGQKFYGRYNDDWYIMSPDKAELEDLLVNIRKQAAEIGIHLNEKKTRIIRISGTYKFLQIKYSLCKDGKVVKRINPERVTAMRKKLKKLAEKVENGERTYEDVESTFRGWMGDHYKLMSRIQREHMLQLYQDLFRVAIKIENRKMIITPKEVFSCPR